ncbi:unnamed protein product [Rhizophagus irregularis]|nr:unnamed protein product [Rhizophagus irregularis]
MERQENYIYGGTINIDHKEAADILNLLIVSFKYSDFTKLQNYWTTTICEQSEILFNATNFTSVGKEGLLSICKNKNWCMEENELWDHIIRWGKAQNTELLKEINNWTTNDFNILEKTIVDFIPNVRFYDISSDNFYHKIMPYCVILPKDLYQDLSRYHLLSNWQPKFNNLRPRENNITIDSKLINDEQAELISS